MLRICLLLVVFVAALGCGGSLNQVEVPTRAAGVYEGTWTHSSTTDNIDLTLESDGDITGKFFDFEGVNEWTINGHMNSNGDATLTLSKVGETSISLTGQFKIESVTELSANLTKQFDLTFGVTVSLDRTI